MVKACYFDWNRINHLKFKIAERFELTHFIYSFLFSKIYNRTNPCWIQRKNDFDFQFQNWRKRKQQKYDVAKEPSNYVDRKNEKHTQSPIDISIDNNNQSSARVNIAKNVNTKKKINQKRKMLEQQLEENTLAMKKMLKSK